MAPPSLFLLAIFSILLLFALGSPIPSPDCSSDNPTSSPNEELASLNPFSSSSTLIPTASGTDITGDGVISSRSNVARTDHEHPQCVLPLRYRYRQCNEEETKQWNEEYDSCLRMDNEATNYQCKKAASLATKCVPAGIED